MKTIQNLSRVKCGKITSYRIKTKASVKNRKSTILKTEDEKLYRDLSRSFRNINLNNNNFKIRKKDYSSKNINYNTNNNNDNNKNNNNIIKSSNVKKGGFKKIKNSLQKKARNVTTEKKEKLKEQKIENEVNPEETLHFVRVPLEIRSDQQIEVDHKNISANNNTNLQPPNVLQENYKTEEDEKPKFDRSLLSYQKYPKKIKGIRVTKKFLLQSKGLNWKEVTPPPKPVLPPETPPEPEQPCKPSVEKVVQETETMRFKKDVFMPNDNTPSPDETNMHSRSFLQQRILNEHKPIRIKKFSEAIQGESRPSTKINHNNNSQGGRNSSTLKMCINNHNSRKSVDTPPHDLKVVCEEFQEPTIVNGKKQKFKNEKVTDSQKKSVFKKLKMKRISFKTRFLQSKIPVWSKKEKIATEEETCAMGMEEENRCGMMVEEGNRCEHARTEEDEGREDGDVLLKWRETPNNAIDTEAFKVHGHVTRHVNNDSGSDMVTETGCATDEKVHNKLPNCFSTSSMHISDCQYSQDSCHNSKHIAWGNDYSQEADNFRPTPSPKIKVYPKTRKKHLQFFKSDSNYSDHSAINKGPSPMPRYTPQMSPYRTYTPPPVEPVPTVTIIRKSYPFQSESNQCDPLPQFPSEEIKNCSGHSINIRSNESESSSNANEATKTKKDTDFTKIMKSFIKKQDAEVKDSLLKALLQESNTPKKFPYEELRYNQSACGYRNKSASNKKNNIEHDFFDEDFKKKAVFVDFQKNYFNNMKKNTENSLKSLNVPIRCSTASNVKKERERLPHPSLSKHTKVQSILKKKENVEKRKNSVCKKPKKEEVMHSFQIPESAKYLTIKQSTETFKEVYPDYQSPSEKYMSMAQKVQTYKNMFLTEKPKTNSTAGGTEHFPIHIRNYKSPPNNAVKPFQHWLINNNLNKHRDADENEVEDDDSDDGEKVSNSPPLNNDENSHLAIKFFEKLVNNKNVNNNKRYMRKSVNNPFDILTNPTSNCSNNCNITCPNKHNNKLFLPNKNKMYSKEIQKSLLKPQVDNKNKTKIEFNPQRRNKKPIKMSLVQEPNLEISSKSAKKFQPNTMNPRRVNKKEIKMSYINENETEKTLKTQENKALYQNIKFQNRKSKLRFSKASTPVMRKLNLPLKHVPNIKHIINKIPEFFLNEPKTKTRTKSCVFSLN